MYGQMVRPYMHYIAPDDHCMWLAELKQDYQAGINAVEGGLYDRFLRRSEANGKTWPREATGLQPAMCRLTCTTTFFLPWNTSMPADGI
jgi:hypothetical protein